MGPLDPSLAADTTHPPDPPASPSLRAAYGRPGDVWGMCMAGLSVCVCFCTWAGKSRCAFATKTGVDESGILLCKDLNGSIPLQPLCNIRQTCVFICDVIQ